MKKLIALFLSALLLSALCACGGEAPRGEIISNDTTEAPFEAPIDVAENTTDAPAESDTGISLGETAGQTYQNPFIGIGCTLSEDWTFYTDEQIRELNSVTTDLAGEEFQQVIENAAIIYDMYAVHSNQMNSINVNMEKINALQLIAMDLEANMEAASGLLEQGLANMGYTNFTYEIGKTAIGGKEFVCMDTSSEISGIVMYQRLISIKCNGYLANVTVSTFGENTVDSLMESFFLVAE